MVVRKMCLEDAEAVYTLSQACFSEPWSLESIVKEMDNTVATYFVAEEDEKVIGYAGLWHVLDEGDIINIAVEASLRKKGIGKALLERLLNEGNARGLQVIHLEVRESNLAAIALYEKYGFKTIALRKGYYHKPLENALIMEYKVEER